LKARWKSSFLILITLAAFVGVIFCCSSQKKEKSHTLTVGFAAMNVEMTWMKFAYHAMHRKADKLGVTLVSYDANNELDKQVVNIYDLIQRGVDAIITDPIDIRGLIPALKLAHSKGIPVVVFDRSSVGSPYLFFVGSDDIEAGRLACRFLAEKLQGTGKIIVLEGAAESSPAINRSRGFYEELKKYPALEVVYAQSGKFLREEGYIIMEEALAKVAHFDAIYSQNDDMILGALEAMENAGIDLSTIVTIGTDGIPEALKAIREGRLAGTIQYPISQAEIAIEKLVYYLTDGTLPEWKKYLVKPWVITRKNISTGDFYSLIPD